MRMHIYLKNSLMDLEKQINFYNSVYILAILEIESNKSYGGQIGLVAFDSGGSAVRYGMYESDELQVNGNFTILETMLIVRHLRLFCEAMKSVNFDPVIEICRFINNLVLHIGHELHVPKSL